MQSTTRRILESLDDPQALEALYRQDPQAFCDSLDEADLEASDSTTLSVWRARLEYQKPVWGADRHRMWSAIMIGLAVGALVRLPAIWLGEAWYYPRLAPSLVVLALAAYFWIRHPDRGLLVAGLGLTIGAVVYVGLLPGDTDSVVMALIHLPFVFWALLGAAFLGDSWRDPKSRIRFVRYNGELLVVVSLLALGGMVLSGVTVALFELILDQAEDLYFNNIAVCGAAAVPVIGTYLYDSVFHRSTGFATALARVFAPLFLFMVVVYLVFAFAGGKNPFIDRSFLIAFNALLMLVLGISVFSLVERTAESEVGLIDYISIALIALTLLIDAIALSAILFRLASYGFTPNRVTVLGVNLIVMVHLAWIGVTYLGLIRRRVGFAAVHRVVANYLPVYVAWAALVAFFLPLAFGFA